MMLAADGNHVWAVFLGSAIALVLVALASALLGDVLYHAVPPRLVHVGAGLAFMVIGALLITDRI